MSLIYERSLRRGRWTSSGSVEISLVSFIEIEGRGTLGGSASRHGRKYRISISR